MNARNSGPNQTGGEKEKITPYSSILDFVQRIIKYDYAALYRLDEKRQQLELVAQKGECRELLDGLKFRFGEGLSAWVAEWKKPILLTRKKDIPQGSPLGSFLSLPLWYGGRIIGILSLAHRSSNGLGIREQKLCKLLSERIATLMERINFLQDLKESYLTLYRSVKDFELFYERMLKREKLAQERQFDAALKSKIRNPLSVILGNAEILLNELDGEKGELKKRLEAIIAEGQKIAQVANQELETFGACETGESKISASNAENL